jgi:hypothetical protein
VRIIAVYVSISGKPQTDPLPSCSATVSVARPSERPSSTAGPHCLRRCARKKGAD